MIAPFSQTNCSLYINGKIPFFYQMKFYTFNIFEYFLVYTVLTRRIICLSSLHSSLITIPRYLQIVLINTASLLVYRETKNRQRFRIEIHPFCFIITQTYKNVLTQNFHTQMYHIRENSRIKRTEISTISQSN